MSENLKKLTWKDFFHFMCFPMLGLLLMKGFYILVTAFNGLSSISSYSQLPVTPTKQIVYILVLVTAGFVFMSPLLLYGVKDKMISWGKLGLSPLVIDWKKVWKIALLGAVVVLLEIVADYLLETMGISLKSKNPSPIHVIVSNNFFLYLYFVLFIGIIAPVMEEIYFRGFFYSWLRRFFKPSVSTFISASIFGLLHTNSIFSVCYAFAFGIITAYLYERDKNLVSSIVFHITVNTLVYLVNFYAPKF